MKTDPHIAYGCGPLSLAVLANDTDQVKHFLEYQPTALNERNELGQSPLHLAGDKPLCLQLLVEAAIPVQINQVDNYGWSALDTAMIVSSNLCNNNLEYGRCSRCNCADSVAILLKSDCAILMPHYGLQYILRASTTRCQSRYISHLKDRRRRLKQLALNNLPFSDIKALRLDSKEILDVYAPQTVNMLHQHNVEIPDALSIVRDGCPGDFQPVYRALSDYRHANKFFDMGFCEVDDAGGDRLPPLACHGIGAWHSVNYLSWLVDHGANIFRPLDRVKSPYLGKGASSAHHVFCEIGKLLGTRMNLSPRNLSSIHALNAIVIPSSLADYCQCRCTLGGCTPFINMLKTMPRYRHNQHASDMIHIFSSYLNHFWSDLNFQHHTSAVRYLTFSALEIVHTCCIQGLYGGCINRTNEEINEIREEEAPMLDLLEELLEEFQSRVDMLSAQASNGPYDFIAFLEGYWSHRMKEVPEDIDGDDVCEEERRAAEEIGVTWKKESTSDSTNSENPYNINMPEHWFYKLDQIAREPTSNHSLPLSN